MPDLVLLPERYAKVETVQFRAALEFSVEHFMLAGLAGLRRVGIPIPIDSWAGPFERMAALLGRWGGEKGGMLVSLTGSDANGKPKRVEWHLTAGWREGPEIPCLAAIILAERLAKGVSIPLGGRPCMGYLELKDFEPEFKRLGIETTLIETSP